MDQAAIDSAIQVYYANQFDESVRLTSRSAQGAFEFIRVQEIIADRTGPPSRILDIGGPRGSTLRLLPTQDIRSLSSTQVSVDRGVELRRLTPNSRAATTAMTGASHSCVLKESRVLASHVFMPVFSPPTAPVEHAGSRHPAHCGGHVPLPRDARSLRVRCCRARGRSWRWRTVRRRLLGGSCG